MLEHARFTFAGRLHKDSFVDFARHRAARLGLRLELGRASDTAVTLDVTGVGELVDAFEMACSLGPYDCLVLEVTRGEFEFAA